MSETTCYACGSRNITAGLLCNSCKVMGAYRGRPALAVREMIEWQTIETAPADEIVLLWEDGLIEMGLQEGGDWHGFRAGRIEPTHWMPLPKPPMRAPFLDSI